MLQLKTTLSSSGWCIPLHQLCLAVLGVAGLLWKLERNALGLVLHDSITIWHEVLIKKMNGSAGLTCSPEKMCLRLLVPTRPTPCLGHELVTMSEEDQAPGNCSYMTVSIWCLTEMHRNHLFYPRNELWLINLPSCAHVGIKVCM